MSTPTSASPASSVVTTIPETVLASVRSASTPTDLSTAVTTLTISSNDEYTLADTLLFRIRSARKAIAERVESQINSPYIEPLRKVLDRLYANRRTLLAELDQPLERLEQSTKAKMATWQEAERERLRQERVAAERERQRLEDEKRKAEEEARAAATPADRGLANHKAAMIDQHLELTKNRQVDLAGQRPVKAAGSKVTVKKVWEVADFMALVKGVVEGTVPPAVLQVNDEVMDVYWEQDRGLVSVWPGVTIVEKTTVGGK